MTFTQAAALARGRAGLGTDGRVWYAHVMSQTQSTRPATYLPTPADAPVVTVTDHANGEVWQAVVVDGIVHDASGVIDPDDIGWRFTVTPDDLVWQS